MKIITSGIRSFCMVLMLTCAASLTPVMAGDDADALFQLGDKTYGLGDLPDMLQQSLYEAELKFHQDKEALIDEALVVMEIEKRAAASDKSGDEIAAELFSADKPSDETVAAFYEENKARINQPMDAIKPQIVQLLTQQAQAEKQQAFLVKLKGDDFKLLLAKPQAPESEIDISGFPFKGPEDAKVVLVEFADYQCPHCKRASGVLKKVAAQFKDDLKIVFMDYPINRSGISRKIAEGAVCAAAQDKFWEYHDLAFADQRALRKDSAPKFAEQLELDSSAFAACLASDKPVAHVKRGEEQGKLLGVNATPTLFLNGRKLHVHDLEADLPQEIQQVLSAVN